MAEKPKISEFNKHMRVLKHKLSTYLPETQPPDVLIIKAHLTCEYYINQVLLVIEKCSSKQVRSFTFSEKIKEAFDLNEANELLLYRKMKILNELRNRAGHELEYTLSESDVDRLGYLDGKEYILWKYDFDTNEKTLHHVLTMAVIDLAFFVFKLIEAEKKTLKKN